MLNQLIAEFEKEEEKEFDKRFKLESQGCSECGGFELIDNEEVRYPKGKYHCEYDLDKIKLFNRQHRRQLVRKVVEILDEWSDDKKIDTDGDADAPEGDQDFIRGKQYGYNLALSDLSSLLSAVWPSLWI